MYEYVCMYIVSTQFECCVHLRALMFCAKNVFTFNYSVELFVVAVVAVAMWYRFLLLFFIVSSSLHIYCKMHTL